MSLSKSALLPATKPFRRLIIIGSLLLFLLAVFLLLEGSGTSRITVRLQGVNDQAYTPKIGRCSHGERQAWAKQWNITARDHHDLLDDRFTIALSTFHRPKELQRTLDTLLSEPIPSLHEVVIVWNNIDQQAPSPFVSPHGVSVRYRTPPCNSLNEKLLNDPSYRTRAVLLSDDDVFYRPADLEFVFQTWRRFGRDRVTGALARCARVSPSGSWEYTFCEGTAGRYAMVLTNLAFVDVDLLDAYNVEGFPPVDAMRGHVDAHMNCEDIALNFVAAARATNPDSRADGGGGQAGALLVRGSNQYVNLDPSGGISMQGGHMEARSECLNVFAEAFGCMPLVDEVARIEFGVKHNVWYRTLLDMIRK